MIDASIPLGVKPVQIESPLNSLAQIAQLQGAQQQNQLLGLKMQEAQRAVDDQTALRTGLAAPNADPGKVLLGLGKVKEYTEYQKAQDDRTKSQAATEKDRLETAHKRVDILGQASGWLRANPTPENALAVTQHLLENGVLTAEQAQASIAKIQANPSPESIAQGADMAFRTSLQAKEQLPKIETHNIGGATVTQAVDPITGKPTTTGQVQNTQAPGSAATLAETARHNQVIESQGAATLSKPFEVTGPDGNAVLVQQDKQGNLIPAQGYAPKGGGKPLPNAALKTITEVRDTANTIDRLASSFKPAYAEKGVYGFGAEASLSAKGVMGTDQDAVDWWKNYRKQAELVERHSMFGAALTPGEQASWRSADIGPGMHPGVIQRNLKTRQELTAKMLDTTRQDLIDAGHSEQRINAIAGRGPKPADATPPAAGNAPLVNGKGWTLHTDAKGNKAYVSPDGKQFEAAK